LADRDNDVLDFMQRNRMSHAKSTRASTK
jgi:hypothetical protein